MSILRTPKGNTVAVTWASSGAGPTNVYVSLYDVAGSLVSSATMVSSDADHYYFNLTLPNTADYYTVKTVATIGGKPYINWYKVKTLTVEVS